jgi:hypothetical protein
VRKTLLVSVIVGLLAGCPADSDRPAPASLATTAGSPTASALAAGDAVGATLPVAHSSVAAMPDRGSLLDYPAQAPVRRGAAIWHPVQMSEAHALAAIGAGGMVVSTPEGKPIRLQYLRHTEHADGNWSWIGRPEGVGTGQDAVLTFGPKAVFGSIPVGNGQSLDITTSGGRTWMVEPDQRIAADERYVAATAIASDALRAPTAATTRASAAPAMRASAAPATDTQGLTSNSSSAVVDLVLGYTSAFATRLGGTSQAVTRLNFMVDIANQAFANSRVNGRVRLVHTIQVNYPDATLNRSALFALSGLNCNVVSNGTLHLPDIDANCTTGSVPAALQPLIAARDTYGADLVSLVRTYQVPENQSCGVSWLIGGGQTAIDASDAPYALSVISDTSGAQFPDSGSTCRNETLAHEIGHNMGLAHDRVAAARSDGVLSANEYGRFGYSFGYRTDSANGNFYTIMSIPAPGQTSMRLFSNPRINDCAGHPCGVAGQSDNAGTLSLTMPLVAKFRAARVQGTGIGLSVDINGGGKADVVWRNGITGSNAIWLSGNQSTQASVSAVTDTSWVAAGVGDFDGNHKGDILWRNTATGTNAIWLNAQKTTQRRVSPQSSTAWEVAGVGDFNGDGRSDILWRNSDSGANVIWKSGLSAQAQAVQAQTDTNWVVAGVGDFNRDGKADILWRNIITGANAIWRSGNVDTPQSINAVTSTAWVVAGVADFNGDGKADILWRNTDTGSNAIWLSGSKSTQQAVRAVTDTSFNVEAVGDFNGDHKADIFWVNAATGETSLWLSANINTKAPSGTVRDMSWSVVD